MFVNRPGSEVTELRTIVRMPTSGDPAQPALRVIQISERGERLRPLPGAVERRDAALGDDGVAEALALLVLAQLELEADQALEHPHRPGSGFSAPFQALS